MRIFLIKAAAMALALGSTAYPQRMELTMSSTPGADPGPGIPACSEAPGWFKLYDGSKTVAENKAIIEKYWFIPTGQKHGNGGHWWLQGDTLYSNQNSGGNGGALYTKRKYGHFEAKTLVKPGWGNDGGFFMHANTYNRSYQNTIDYHQGDQSCVGGIFGESGLHAIRHKPFGFGGNPSSITIRPEWYMDGKNGHPKMTAADWPTTIWKVDKFNWVQARMYHGEPPWIDTYANGFQMTHYEDGEGDPQLTTGYFALQVHGNSGWSSNNTPNLYKDILIRVINADATPLASYPEWTQVCGTPVTFLAPQESLLKIRMERNRQLVISGKAEGPYILKLSDLTGRSVYETNVTKTFGEQIIPLPAQGAQILEIQGNGFRQVEKLNLP